MELDKATPDKELKEVLFTFIMYMCVCESSEYMPTVDMLGRRTANILWGNGSLDKCCSCRCSEVQQPMVKFTDNFLTLLLAVV